jgi:hypothetical protein
MKIMTPLIGILDDCDAPEARMIVLLWGDQSDPSAEYISSKVRPLNSAGSAGRRFGHFPKRFTELTKFGVMPEFDPDGLLVIRVVGPSVATYPDGVPRRWQGYAEVAISPRLRLAGPVIAAVRAIRTRVAAQLVDA